MMLTHLKMQEANSLGDRRDSSSAYATVQLQGYYIFATEILSTDNDLTFHLKK